jgi:hypothetical protein
MTDLIVHRRLWSLRSKSARLSRTWVSRWSLATLAVAALGACGSDSATPTTVAGTYRLSTIGGSAVPVTTAAITGSPVQVISATVTFAADGTFSGQVNISQTVGGVGMPSTLPLAGKWSVLNTRLTVTDTATGTVLTGTAQGGQINLSWNGTAFVFVAE